MSDKGSSYLETEMISKHLVQAHPMNILQFSEVFLLYLPFNRTITTKIVPAFRTWIHMAYCAITE